MDVELIILFAVLGLLLSLWVATLFKKTAADKGYDSPLYFWLSFLFGAVGWALVIALPDKKLKETQETISKKLDKQIELLKAAPKAVVTPEEANKPEAPKYERVPEKPADAPKAEAPKATDGRGQIVTALRGDKDDTVICPNCGEAQRAGRKVCWNCGAKFVETSE